MFCKHLRVQLHSCSTSTCGQKVFAARKGSLHAVRAASTTRRAAPTSAHWPSVLRGPKRHGLEIVSARPLGFEPHFTCSKVTRCQDLSDSSSKTSLSVSAPKFTMLPTAEGDGPTDQISVISRDGKLYSVSFKPGTTTVGELRASVAKRMDAAPDMVRLAYQGQELLAADDDRVFVKRQEADVMHAMRKDNSADSPPPPNLPAKYTTTTVPETLNTSEVLKVYTMEGKVLKMSVTPGFTTAGSIRKGVATAMGAASSEIRLQYAGKELDPGHDAKPLDLKTLAKSTQKEYIMHAMTRMQGGQTHRSNNRTLVGSIDNLKSSKQYPKSLSNMTNTRLFDSSVPKSTRQQSLQCSSTTSLVVLGTSHAAPGAGRGPKGLCQAQLAEVQLAKQFRDLMKHPIPGVSVAPDEENTMKWHARLAGPEGTPYFGGWFHVELTFTDRFPGRAPNMRFMTKIWHPNIHEVDGRVCMSVGANVRSVGCLLAAVQLLLAHPNTESTLNHHCASEMRGNISKYWELARTMTKLYAIE